MILSGYGGWSSLKRKNKKQRLSVCASPENSSIKHWQRHSLRVSECATHTRAHTHAHTDKHGFPPRNCIHKSKHFTSRKFYYSSCTERRFPRSCVCVYFLLFSSKALCLQDASPNVFFCFFFHEHIPPRKLRHFKKYLRSTRQAPQVVRRRVLPAFPATLLAWGKKCRLICSKYLEREGVVSWAFDKLLLYFLDSGVETSCLG